MKILLACEFYHPSRGGVQEVMRQIAERLVSYGHDVTVATTRLPEREFSEFNGVKIVEFDLSGNRANGIRGDVSSYVEFLKAFEPDAFMIKAAQQWTFDASWDALDAMTCRKVFIPCGFSGLYLPEYATYFEELPWILRKFDQLIFYAERYRDIDFARAHGLETCVFLPNGASDVEFAVPADPSFRERHGIGAEDLVLITVGSPISMKGHAQVAEAFAKLSLSGRPMTLILNGNWPQPVPLLDAEPAQAPDSVPPAVAPPHRRGFLERVGDFHRDYGFRAFAVRVGLWAYYRTLGLLRAVLRPFATLARTVLNGAIGLINRMRPASPPIALIPIPKSIEDWIAEAEAQDGKRVLKTSFPRDEVVQAFLNADLFVFASIVEYSPLVLFEAGAAGVPFLTVPVGNAEEIVRWTGGGVVCPAEKDGQGYTRVDPDVLADAIENLLKDTGRLRSLGEAGREAWRREYNWEAIARRYEAVLLPAA